MSSHIPIFPDFVETKVI